MVSPSCKAISRQAPGVISASNVQHFALFQHNKLVGQFQNLTTLVSLTDSYVFRSK
jgi:hypothetical protein